MIVQENTKQELNINPYFDYFSRICCEQKQFTSIDQFTNGIVFNEVLCMLNSFQITDLISLDGQPNNFAHKLSNLKILKKAIYNYWLIVLKSPISIAQIDLIELSKNSNEKEYQKLAKLVVITLFKSDQRQKFIQTMLKTSTKTQQFFMSILQQSKTIIKSQSNQNSRQKFIYDKLLQLQNQNERIILIVEQLSSQKEELLSRQVRLEKELEQKSKQIERLKWHVFQLQNQKQNPTNLTLRIQQKQHVTLHEQIQLFETQLSQTKKINQQLIKKNIENEVNMQIYLQSLKSLKSQIYLINEQKSTIIKQNQFLCENIRKLQDQIKQCYHTVNSLRKVNQQQAQKNQQLDLNLTKMQQKLQDKQRLIEELYININLLTENKHFQEQQSQNYPSAQKSSIKQQCSKSFLTLQKQNNLTTLINQNMTIQGQKMEIQKLKAHEIQNKKLTAIINHMNKYRGEQNEILVKCLYKMRLKMLDKTLKQSTNAHNNRNLLVNQSIK